MFISDPDHEVQGQPDKRNRPLLKQAAKNWHNNNAHWAHWGRAAPFNRGTLPKCPSCGEATWNTILG